MKKLLYLIILAFIVTNCSLKPVVKHHGVPFLEKKQATLIVNESNKNDIKKILGNPSTKSTFDNDVWIYIERKESKTSITTLGRRKLTVNNVLILEFDKYGILSRKKLLDKKDIKKIKFSKNETYNEITSKSFVERFLSSVRSKMYSNRK